MSQLFEMLPMNQEEVKQITSDMTVAQIRDFKKKSKEKKENENRDIPGQTNTCKEKELLEETVIPQMESQEHLQPSHICSRKSLGSLCSKGLVLHFPVYGVPDCH